MDVRLAGPFDKCIADVAAQRYTAHSIRWETGIGMDGLSRASSIRNFGTTGNAGSPG